MKTCWVKVISIMIRERSIMRDKKAQNLWKKDIVLVKFTIFLKILCKIHYSLPFQCSLPTLHYAIVIIWLILICYPLSLRNVNLVCYLNRTYPMFPAFCHWFAGLKVKFFITIFERRKVMLFLFHTIYTIKLYGQSLPISYW